jgi:hypothetical protein
MIFERRGEKRKSVIEERHKNDQDNRDAGGKSEKDARTR